MHATTGSQSSVAGLDLHLDRRGGRVGDGVMDAIRDAIRSGRLVPGIQLPSSRALAADLGVARNTVVRAYAELIAEGWLTSQHGSGTLVAQRAAEVVRSVASPLSEGRSAGWTTTCDRDIRTCRRFHGRSGVVRSSAR
jgi:GntR family transcriptional regulator/MocR family aminotransferase